jgi:8-oxo-dGTP pyrophosphatase MutT (NUDIX family)
MSDKTSPNSIEEPTIKIVGRRLSGENKRFFVYLDHVVDQAGFEVQDYLVVSPKVARENLVTGVAILPIVGDRIALIRIYRPPLRNYSWEIPHGFVGEGESEACSASRELLEETGLRVAQDALISLGYLTPDSGLIAARVHLFLAQECVYFERTESELGLRELRLFSVQEFERMIDCSEIQDAFTLAAWCRHRINTK